MSDLKSRITKLETMHTPARRIVVRYADKTPPEELQALRADDSVTLLVVEYYDRQVQREQA